jgi:hypothetical protein
MTTKTRRATGRIGRTRLGKRFSVVIGMTAAFVLSSCAEEPADTCTSMCARGDFDEGTYTSDGVRSTCVCTGGGAVSEVLPSICEDFCLRIGVPDPRPFNPIGDGRISACECAFSPAG